MSLPVYSLSAEKFEALEDSLRASGFRVEKRNAPGKLGSLRTRDGFASAVIFDLTEKKNSEPQVGVGCGRNGLFSSLFLWPFDRKHVHAVQEHLVRIGARPVVFSPNEKG